MVFVHSSSDGHANTVESNTKPINSFSVLQFGNGIVIKDLNLTC